MNAPDARTVQRPWWGWPITLLTGAVVAALAPFYWTVHGLLALPSGGRWCGRRVARGWHVSTLWVDERWRARHQAARRLRELAKRLGRQRERSAKRLRRLPATVSRAVFRDLPQRSARTARRAVRAGRVLGSRARGIVRKVMSVVACSAFV